MLLKDQSAMVQNAFAANGAAYLRRTLGAPADSQVTGEIPRSLVRFRLEHLLGEFRTQQGVCDLMVVKLI